MGRHLLVAALFLLVAFRPTYIERQPFAYVTSSGHGASEWAKVCRRYKAATGQHYVLPCARVSGVVVYREHQDPDGDGDAHLVLLTADGPVIVKVAQRLRAASIPPLGSLARFRGRHHDGPAGVPRIDVAETTPPPAES